MKKMIKHEWKRYLAFIFLTSVLLLGYRIYIMNSWGTVDNLEAVVRDYNGEKQLEYANGEEFGEYDISELCYDIWDIVIQISYGFLYGNNICMMIGILLLLKSFRYWNERNSYGREFVVTLPVKERARKGFYVGADFVLVISTMLIYTVGMLAYVTNLFEGNAIEIPWLKRAVMGEMLTSIAYILMILGVIEFLEILFVDGKMKIAGTVGIFAMVIFLLETAAEVLYKENWVQEIYGFFTLNRVGNQYALTENKCIEWTHVITNPEVLFQGQPLIEVIAEKSQWSEHVMQYFEEPEFCRMYDFSHISTYAGYAAGYLIIGCIMTGIAIWLAGKTEASKSGFYFAFGRYLISILVGVTFLAFCIKGAVALWHKILIVVAAFGVAVLLIYKTNPERRH